MQPGRLLFLGLLGISLCLGFILGGISRSGWPGGLMVPTGCVLAILSAAAVARALRWRVHARAGRNRERARADRFLAALVAREQRYLDGPEALDTYDPRTGEGLGEFLVEPEDLCLENIGGEAGIRHLLGRFQTETCPTHRRVADRMLACLGVDARTGDPRPEDEMIQMRIQRLERARLGSTVILSPRAPPHLMVGIVLLVGMAAVCALVAAERANWLILLVALGTGILAACMLAEEDGI